MADIFISYSRIDREIASKVADALTAAGIDIWWDTQLQSGETYDEVTEQALNDAKAVIVLWSAQSVKSRWVRSEATVADRNGTLLPAMIEPCTRPVMFELTQSANLCDWDGGIDHPLWQAFLSDIQKMLRVNATVSAISEPKAGSKVAGHSIARPTRRIATVLHCAMLPNENTQFEIDPEDWREEVTAFHAQCSEILSTHGGTLSTEPAEAITSVFGEMQSREDDAIRAVTAALEIITWQQSNQHTADFSVQIGVETGTIVSEGHNVNAFGPVIGKAERLQTRSEQNGILMGGACEVVAGAYFELKGAPGGGFQVQGQNTTQTRFDVSRARGLSAFVGRTDDFAILNDALESASSGASPVIGIVAEAGTGKSRLCYEFTEQCRNKGIPIYEGRAVAHGRNVPLLPVLGIFRSFFDIEVDDADDHARQKIEDRLLALDVRFTDTLPLLFDFLSVPDPDRPASRFDPNIRQRKVVGAMRQAFKLASDAQTSVTLFEDVHWMDPASVQFLDQMVEPGAGVRNLLILNYRPEFKADWMNKSWFRQLPLKPLDQAAIEQLLTNILGSDKSVAKLTEPILQRTGGNPFFAEELVRSLVETNHLEGERGDYKLMSAVEKISAPATVQSIIASRIDRLSDVERHVLQLAAVIGKDFEQALLTSASDYTPVEIDAVLDKLRRAEFILEKSFFPETEYTFCHPLTQEVALGSLLRETRRDMHAAVASAIEAQGAGLAEERAALLATHWEAAGDNLAAARYHRIAAEWMGLTDLTSAAWHWGRVRYLLRDALSGKEAAALGVAACQHLLNLGWRFGIDADEVTALEADGRAFAQSVDDWHAELNVSMVCSRALASVGDVAGFVALARKNYIDAMKVEDTALQVNASLYLVDALVWTAELPEALKIAEAALERVSKEVPPSEWIMGFNPHTVLKFWRATCLVMMGRLSEGLEEYRQCRPLLEADGTPEGVAYLLSWSALAYLSAGDIAQVEACSKEVDRVCTEIGNPATVVAHRHLCQTYLHLAAGQADEAVVTATAALKIHKVSEQQHAGMTATFVAEALLRAGRVNEAVLMAEEAIGTCQHSRRANLEAQAHCVHASALLARDGVNGLDKATKAISTASDLITSTGAQSLAPGLLELRSAVAALTSNDQAQRSFLEEAANLYEQIGSSPNAERIRCQIK